MGFGCKELQVRFDVQRLSPQQTWITTICRQPRYMVLVYMLNVIVAYVLQMSAYLFPQYARQI